MIAMMEYSGYGVEGIVSDAVTGDPIAAIVQVNNGIPTYSDATAGDYHKYVVAGTYSITVMANGYETQTIDNIAVTANNSTATDFQLQPADGQYVYKFSSSQIPDNNEADEGWTPAVLGAPDEQNYSLGKNGWVVLDMQTPVIDGPGFDFIVYEGDSSPEDYTCYAGETIDGPWISLGLGSGTSEFDLSNGSLAEAQFIKLMDDGDGSANANDAGFDLDAIEALEPVSGIYIAMYDYELDDSNGNNNGRIDPGETVDVIVTLKNNGDILAENTTGLISTTSQYITIDNNQASFGNLAQGQSEEGTYTFTADANTPEGEAVNVMMEVSANGGTYSITFNMSFTIGLIIEDWESGTFEQFDWETGGSNDWDLSTQQPYEGAYCVKSGTIGDEEVSWLSITFQVLASGEIGFYKKVSSEDTYDFLKFYIDGSVADQWSGEVSWSESTYPVSSGVHTFKWEYEKDYSVSNGDDCAWLDFISLPSGAMNALTAGFLSNTTEICEEGTVEFTDASSGNVISWEWEFEGGDPATSSDQNPTVAYFNAGTYDVVLTISDGSDSNTLTLEDYIAVMAAPATPEKPTGPDVVASTPNSTDQYVISVVPGADSYEWMLDPAEAGDITVSGEECVIDWTDYWVGEVSLSVRALNECGESDYSETLDIIVLQTGIDNKSNDVYSIHPNPSNGIFNISVGQIESGKVDVIVLDNLGKQVYTQNDASLSAGELLKIDLANFEKGVYFLVLKSETTTFNKKLILK